MKDGTVIIESEVGSYKFIDDNRIKMEFSGRGSVMVNKVSFGKEGQLILTSPQGSETFFVTKAEWEKIEAAAKAEQTKKEAEEKSELESIKLRFKNNGDGTVTDNQTGLMWTREIHPFGYICSFDLAPERIATMNTGNDPLGHQNFGYKDWRLPSNKELVALLTTLSKYYSYKNFQDSIPFDGLAYRPCYYTKTGALDQKGRETNVGLGIGLQKCNVWPVRGGQ